MRNSTRERTSIPLSEGFGTAVVEGPNICLEIHESGNIFVRHGHFYIQSQTPNLLVTLSTSALRIGDRFPEGHPHAGLVYAGRAADLNHHLLVQPSDLRDEKGERLCLTFDQAAAHAKAKGMTVLDKEDLALLAERADAIGGFDTDTCHYWSASEDKQHAGHAWVQRFSANTPAISHKNLCHYTRCARRCFIV